MLTLPQRLWFKCKEVLGSLLICKLDENRALEQPLWGTAKTNSICWTVLSKESLDIKLRTWLLIAEAFHVDESGF